MKSFKEYIKEMPYLMFNKDKMFDLELEIYGKDKTKFKERLINLITSSLNGTPIKDKYDNPISLNQQSTKTDIQNFLNHIYDGRDNDVGRTRDMIKFSKEELKDILDQISKEI